MKKTRRRATAAAGVGLVALGLWLGSMFRGFLPGGSAPGPRVDVSSESGDPTPEVIGDEAEETLETSTVVEERPAESEAAEEPGAPEVLVVLIREDDYAIGQDADQWESFEPATRDEVVEGAKDATGNSDGVRVMILRHESARVAAQSNLYDALEAAGISRDAIHQTTSFVQAN